VAARRRVGQVVKVDDIRAAALIVSRTDELGRCRRKADQVERAAGQIDRGGVVDGYHPAGRRCCQS